MSITNLLTTDTFRTWYNKTNEIIARLNTGTIGDGATAYGVFVVGANSNTSLAVSNLFFVNTSGITAKGNTTIAANTTINSLANVVNISAGLLLIQPITGTIVNSAITVNGVTTFLQAITANANVGVTGDVTITGNVLITGTTTANGLINAQHVIYGVPGAALTPASLTSPQVDNYTTSGLATAQILNLTPNVDVVITGITAPSLSAGGRVLYVQNLSTTYKITFASSNTSSSAANRFKTPNDVSVDVLPGSAIMLLWNYDTQRWRMLAPLTTAFNTLSITGNGSIGGILTITGNLSVGGVSTLTGNVTVTGFLNALGTLQATGANTTLGNTTIQGTTVHSALLTTSANVSLANSALAAVANTLVVTFGNTFNANSSSQSFVRNLKANTFTSDGVATTANLISSGLASLANVNVSSTMTVTGRLVIPVGTNLWAT